MLWRSRAAMGMLVLGIALGAVVARLAFINSTNDVAPRSLDPNAPVSAQEQQKLDEQAAVAAAAAAAALKQQELQAQVQKQSEEIAGLQTALAKAKTELTDSANEHKVQIDDLKAKLAATEPATTGDQTPFDILIAVLSIPSETDRRADYRASWFRWTKPKPESNSTVGLFFMAKPREKAVLDDLNAEQAKFGDLVLLDNLEEDYRYGLTEKVARIFSWSYINFPKAKFVMKVDMDSWVNLPAVRKEIALFNDSVLERGVYWGYFLAKAFVKRDGGMGEKRYFACETYTPYAAGGAYVLSMKAAEYVHLMYPRLMMYYAEDAAMGTWLGTLNLTRFHDVRFDTEWESRGCINNQLVRHKQPHWWMMEATNNVIAGKPICQHQQATKWAYYIDWLKGPNFCCGEIAYAPNTNFQADGTPNK